MHLAQNIWSQVSGVPISCTGKLAKQMGHISESASPLLSDPLSPGRTVSDVGDDTVPVNSAVGAAPGRIEEVPTPSEIVSVTSIVGASPGRREEMPNVGEAPFRREVPSPSELPSVTSDVAVAMGWRKEVPDVGEARGRREEVPNVGEAPGRREDVPTPSELPCVTSILGASPA
jgi:hypothetical protein